MPKGEKKAGGRPKKTKKWSDKLKSQTAKALEKYAKLKGLSFSEALVAMFYDEKVMDTARLGAAKIICEILVVKESERTIDDKRTGPTIMLPALKERPAIPQVVSGEIIDDNEKRVH